MAGEFEQLILGIQQAAWIMMGKVANPMNGKVEQNIPGAKANIDTLIALQEKTKGNLNEGEEKLLESAISQLQINFNETVDAAQKPSVEKKDSADESKKA